MGQGFCPVRMGLRSTNSHETPIGTRGYQPRFSRHPENAAGSRVSLEGRAFKGASRAQEAAELKESAVRSTEDAGRKPGGRLESLPHKGSGKKFVALRRFRLPRLTRSGFAHMP